MSLKGFHRAWKASAKAQRFTDALEFDRLLRTNRDQEQTILRRKIAEFMIANTAYRSMFL
jgi:hypothetical protein